MVLWVFQATLELTVLAEMRVLVALLVILATPEQPVMLAPVVAVAVVDRADTPVNQLKAARAMMVSQDQVLQPALVELAGSLAWVTTVTLAARAQTVPRGSRSRGRT